MNDWSAADARALYNTARWGDGYFDVNDAGHVVVRPHGAGGPEIDLHALATQLPREGLVAAGELRPGAGVGLRLALRMQARQALGQGFVVSLDDFHGRFSVLPRRDVAHYPRHIIPPLGDVS